MGPFSKRLQIKGGRVVLEEREPEPIEPVTHIYNNIYTNMYFPEQKEPVKYVSGSVWDHGICKGCGKEFYDENQKVCEGCGADLSRM